MTATFDISEFIDGRRVGFYQVRILITCFVIMLLDGFDMQVIGVAVPALMQDWQLKPKDFGLALTAGPVGMILGAAILGPIADRYGRRWPLIVAVTLFGLATLLSAFVSTPDGLALTRLFSGLGLGGVLPNVVALSAEYVPARARGTLSTLTYTGVPIGALASGLVGSWLIPSLGWRSVFFIGGLFPLAIAGYAATRVPVAALASVLIGIWITVTFGWHGWQSIFIVGFLVPLVAFGAYFVFTLPESIRFIAARTEKRHKAAAVIRKIAPEVQLSDSVQFTIHEARQAKVGVASIFGPGRTLPTVLITLIFVCNTFGVYFFMSWLPVFMKQSGLSMTWSLLSTVLLNGGGAVGTVTMGVLIDRYGIFKVVTTSYLIGAIAIASIGIGAEPAVLVPALFLTGTCMMGAQTTMYAVAAMVYPTAIRATGVGSTMGWGRIGSVIGPLIGAAFFTLQWSIAAAFIAASLPIFAGALFIYLVGRVPKRFETTA
ncbi:MAG: MFS transporter [Deltaproteobacteria bacterium]|nr:MFS transporter [Deltaproteobacteria bacterium]